MASVVKYDFNPQLKNPCFIEALPGIGNVGKVAGDFLADSVEAKRFATILSEDFPPQVLLDDDCVIKMACNELWCANINGKDTIFLRGDYQGSTPEGQFCIAQTIMDILLKMDVKRIMTLGGYSTGNMVDSPRVLGAVSKIDMKTEFSDYGVVFSPNDPQAGIVGAAGLFVGFGSLYGIDSICLMGETSGFFVDHKAAKAIVKILESMFDISLELKDLEEKTEQIEALTAKVREVEMQNQYNDLSYIG